MALQSSSLPSKFPRDVLYGPPKHLGQGASQMYTVQGIKHTRVIRDHGNADTTTGEQLRANIEAHKLELGT
eukprot:7913890-Ditylum_brightwellii.AAC.1